MHEDDLRRIHRVMVCCRVDVRDRFGLWTAVTDDVSSRGCRLVTTRNPRIESLLDLTVSSDLFSDILEVTGYVAWASGHRVGVRFASASRTRGISPTEWVEQLAHHAKVLGPEPVGSTGPRLAPSLRRPPSGARSGRLPARPALPDDVGAENAVGMSRRKG